MITRKCGHCGKNININRNNILDVVYFKNKYYHEACFKDLVQDKIEKKPRGYADWQIALNNIFTYKQAAKDKILSVASKSTDELNQWLLDHYDIVTTPSAWFWSDIKNLEFGIYKRRKCKPIDTETLTEAWQWAQPHLDKIAANNSTLGKEIVGEQRLRYDLAILLKHMPDFIKHKAKQKAAAQEMKRMRDTEDIDMSRVGKTTIQNNRKDIGDISDDLFVE